jgi:hypothetical protein
MEAMIRLRQEHKYFLYSHSNSLSIRDTIVDVPLASLETTANVHVRCLAASHPALNLALENVSRVNSGVLLPKPYLTSEFDCSSRARRERVRYIRS